MALRESFPLGEKGLSLGLKRSLKSGLEEEVDLVGFGIGISV